MEDAILYDLAKPRRDLAEVFLLLQNLEELAKNGGGDGLNFCGWLRRLNLIFRGVQAIYLAPRKSDDF